MRNPIRRNKNIGQTQGGRVRDGRSREKFSRIFTRDVWTKLSEEGGKWRVLRENPSRDYYHPCAGAEYQNVLKRLPADLTDPVKGIVLRRTPKFDLKMGIEARRQYRCVVLNAFPRSNEMVWRARPERATIRHYAPWCENWVEEDGLYKLNTV
ncbi:MAG: hypothetical protein R2747_08625 [Pyrinomonadaceae bacterium]